jgi:hypothetical protein
MKVLTEGHKYSLQQFESKEEVQTIQFIEKKQRLKDISQLTQDQILMPNSNNWELFTVNDGTTNEEVIEVLIDRMNYLQSKFPCKENACAITHLQEANMWLYERTRKRIAQNVEGKQLEHK